MTTQTIPRNGLAVAALVLGIVGLVMGIMPLTGALALVLGLLGLALGIPAILAAAKGRGRKTMAIIGTTLSVLAIGLGILGLVILNEAVDDLDRELERIERDFNQNVGP